MPVLAHIGNIPVEEYLPFFVPVVALFYFGRRSERRRRTRVQRILDSTEPLDAKTTSAVVAEWAAGDHRELSPEHVPLLYPPGPDGLTAAELAERVHSDPAVVARLLDDLTELGYIELEEDKASGAPRAWLTPEGADLANLTEDALLAAISAPGRP
ncbi:MAG TPA: helix-turn-helix domain-containing protein [Solirubrobacteraceae bacterium]|jgi:predicted transcriptional regulator|nr:helix-turn-helix domain-containing protein [Solirubrobacteraceae bacterium]